MTALAIALAALFLAAGVGHAACLGYVASLVPSWVGRPQTVVAISGVADIAAAALLALPRTRSVGGAVAAVLIAVYLVSHLDAARRPSTRGPLLQRPAILVLRIAVNLVYLAAALVVSRLDPDDRSTVVRWSQHRHRHRPWARSVLAWCVPG